MSNTKYKNTDIGMVPSEWEVSSFSNYATIERGGSPRPIEKYLTNSVNGINWIKIGDVAPNDKYITKTKEKIIRDGIIHSREVKEGDFILSNSMSFGRPYILKINGCIHDGWLVIKDFNDDFDKDFLYYLLSSDSIQNQYVGLVAGSGVKNLNKDIVKKVLAIKPDSKEQQKIATALIHIDNLINDYEKLIKKKEAIKKGMMQELLTGKKRLNGYRQKWKVVPLEDILAYEQPQAYIVKSTEYIKVGTPVLTAGKTFILGYTNEKESVYDKGDVIIFDDFLTTSRYINFMFKVKSSALKLLTAKSNNVSLKFIYYKMQQIEFNAIDHKRYWISTYSKFKITIPEFNEQKEIVRIIEKNEKYVKTLKLKLNKLKSLKKSMMSNLLTGKIRL